MKILEHQDITKLPFRVDVIVNSAHPTLRAGGGVSGAIHEAAGTSLEAACFAILKRIGYTTLSSAKGIITSGFNLNADSCIHVVASVFEDDKNGRLLRGAYLKALKLARMVEAKSIAFPLLGAGIYGWPQDKAMKIATSVFRKVKDINVYLCLYP